MICFLGTSHAATHLREAARKKGFPILMSPEKATLIFISEDTPTSEEGVRDERPIRTLVAEAAQYNVQMVLTSQVTPGFTRSIGIANIFHQAETLRIKDAEYRAMHPEYIAVGGDAKIGNLYAEYLAAFHCPILRMTWEEAEFSKIAVNMALAAQVDYANSMSRYAEKYGAKWDVIAEVLRHDRRIGLHAYLTPGRWQDSKHLLRDYQTILNAEICG